MVIALLLTIVNQVQQVNKQKRIEKQSTRELIFVIDVNAVSYDAKLLIKRIERYFLESG